MHIEKNKFNRFDICAGEAKVNLDPGFLKKNDRVTGLKGFEGNSVIARVFGCFLSLFNITVRVNCEGKTYYFFPGNVKDFLARLNVQGEIKAHNSEWVQKTLNNLCEERARRPFNEEAPIQELKKQEKQIQNNKLEAPSVYGPTGGLLRYEQDAIDGVLTNLYDIPDTPANLLSLFYSLTDDETQKIKDTLKEFTPLTKARDFLTPAVRLVLLKSRDVSPMDIDYNDKKECIDKGCHFYVIKHNFDKHPTLTFSEEVASSFRAKTPEQKKEVLFVVINEMQRAIDWSNPKPPVKEVADLKPKKEELQEPKKEEVVA